MPKQRKQFVVDIGATNLRFGSTLPIRRLATIPTPQTQRGILTAIRDFVVQFRSSVDAEELLVACPGLVKDSGLIVKALYVPLTGLNLANKLRDLLTIPTFVFNDAKAQAFGCIRRNDSMVYFALGTAIGGALFDHGRLIPGHRGFAGELGHIRVPGLDTACFCGRVGCLDTAASGWSLSKKLGDGWWTRPLDATSRDLVIEAGRCVGHVATHCATLLDPNRIVIAGHLTNSEYFVRGLTMQTTDLIWGRPTVEFRRNTWHLTAIGLPRLHAMRENRRHK